MYCFQACVRKVFGAAPLQGLPSAKLSTACRPAAGRPALILMFLIAVVPAGMLTITDFIIILHRYYKSPLVGSLCRRLRSLLPATVKTFHPCCVAGADLRVGGAQAGDVERLASRQWMTLVSTMTETKRDVKRRDIALFIGLHTEHSGDVHYSLNTLPSKHFL